MGQIIESYWIRDVPDQATEADIQVIQKSAVLCAAA